MTIDWLSFLVGMGAGVLLMSITGLIASYMRLQRARARVEKVEEKVKDFKAQLEKRKEELIGRIKEEQK